MDDSVFEAMLRHALLENLYEEIDSLPPDDELASLYTFSEAHTKRMERLFAREALKGKLFAVAKLIGIIATVVATVIAIAVTIQYYL